MNQRYSGCVSALFLVWYELANTPLARRGPFALAA